MNTRFHDLQFSREPDGSIYLEQQSGMSESDTIFMHPVQLRHIAETFGLVAPSYPADELTKRLARQLCEIQRELLEECYRSPNLELTYAKLDAWCSALPDDIFPFDLWDDGEQPERSSAPKHTDPGTAASRSKKTQQSAIASELNSNPNLYDLLQTGSDN